MKAKSDLLISSTDLPPPGEAPKEMANQICEGFKAHDRKNRQEAISAFNFVDSLQFQHIDKQNVYLAVEAFVSALWAKDELEFKHLNNGSLDEDGIENEDWSPVRKKFRERASLLNIDQEYAILRTEAWRQHKSGGDYWTPFLESQVYELRAALQDPHYPRKPSDGKSGTGPEACRYILAVELHDMHSSAYWEQAEAAMVPYYERIIKNHVYE